MTRLYNWFITNWFFFFGLIGTLFVCLVFLAPSGCHEVTENITVGTWTPIPPPPMQDEYLCWRYFYSTQYVGVTCLPKSNAVK